MKIPIGHRYNNNLLSRISFYQLVLSFLSGSLFMKNVRRFALPVIFGALIMLTASPVLAKDKWIALSTKNLYVVSNADEGDVRELALKIEQFHYIFTQLFGIRTEGFLPVTVMIFKSDSSFKPYKPLYNGKPMNIAGYFQPGHDENLIALTVNSNVEYPMSTIFHEYTHMLNSYTPRQWPLWLKEGIAELYSTFDVRKREVTLGKPISSHVYKLREAKFLPLQDLFTVQHNSPAYNERDKQSIFYAESWALTHYIMYGENGVRKPQLVEFAKLIGENMSADRAFAQAFKTDTATIEKELRRYVGKDAYPGMIYTLSNTEGEKEASVQAMSEAEAQFHLGNLLMRTGRLDEAETYFKQAIALDANLARPYEGLGFIEMRRDHYDKAVEHFKQAVTHDSKNYLAHYYYAEALQRESRGQMSAEFAAKIIDELRAAIKLRPQFAQSHYLLGFMSLVTGENLKEGANAMKMAMRFAPQNRHYAISLAQIQVRMKDYAAAKKSLEPLLAAGEDESLRRSAQSMMEVIEYQMRPPRLESAQSPERSEPAASPQPSDSNQPDGNRNQQVIGRPTVRIAGAQIARGVLTSIECSNGKWMLVVKMPEKVVRFAVTDKENLEFYSQDPSFDGTIGCGAVNRPAFIYFKALPGDQAKFAGDAVAVEITK
jgi:tetratricopeptide (TPR) repeat protein